MEIIKFSPDHMPTACAKKNHKFKLSDSSTVFDHMSQLRQEMILSINKYLLLLVKDSMKVALKGITWTR